MYSSSERVLFWYQLSIKVVFLFHTILNTAVMFQFQPKKTEEVESDSDWDSLPGDVQEPTSSPDSTPRHQPAPPPHSPKGHVSQKRPQIKSQAATPEKNSITNSPVTQPISKPGTPASNRPSQLYGKPGITTFVDRSLNADSGLENRQNKELSPDMNENRLQQDRLGRQNEGIHLEMNEMDHYGHNPPFTDFQGTVALKKLQAIACRIGHIFVHLCGKERQAQKIMLFCFCVSHGLHLPHACLFLLLKCQNDFCPACH